MTVADHPGMINNIPHPPVEARSCLRTKPNPVVLATNRFGHTDVGDQAQNPHGRDTLDGMGPPATTPALAHAAKWDATWKGLGVLTPDWQLYEQLVGRYSERGRSYHTLRHLDECFARLDELAGPVERIHEIELALWFHDAIYDAHRADNEEQSAAWAHREAQRLGVTSEAADRVCALILATKHSAIPQSPEAQVVVDVDLSILGAADDRFDEYERQIREEYVWMPGFLFRRKRREILEAFLARPAIYATSFFREKYEAAARKNLQRSIQALRGRR